MSVRSKSKACDFQGCSRPFYASGYCNPHYQQLRRFFRLAEAVDHPTHYNESPSGVECIDVVEHMNFNRGNAMKYLWRAGSKGDVIEDLKKARWYIEREISRLS